MNRVKFSWAITGTVLVADEICKILIAYFFPTLLVKNLGLPFGIPLPASTVTSRPNFFIFWALTVALLIFILTAGKFFRANRTALSLILGGALSNLADRALLGYVRDYIHLGIGTVNLADVAVWIGIGMLLFNIKNPNPNSEDQTPNKQQ